MRRLAGFGFVRGVLNNVKNIGNNDLDGQPTRRGTPKAKKHKGRKCRLDELEQAKKDFWQAYERKLDARHRELTCKWAPEHRRGNAVCYHGFGQEWYEHCRKRLDTIYASLRKDKLI